MLAIRWECDKQTTWNDVRMKYEPKNVLDEKRVQVIKKDTVTRKKVWMKLKNGLFGWRYKLVARDQTHKSELRPEQGPSSTFYLSTTMGAKRKVISEEHRGVGEEMESDFKTDYQTKILRRHTDGN